MLTRNRPSSLIVCISLILFVGSLFPILSTGLFENNGRIFITISSIYAQEDDGGGDDGGEESYDSGDDYSSEESDESESESSNYELSEEQGEEESEEWEEASREEEEDEFDAEAAAEEVEKISEKNPDDLLHVEEGEAEPEDDGPQQQPVEINNVSPTVQLEDKYRDITTASEDVEGFEKWVQEKKGKNYDFEDDYHWESEAEQRKLEKEFNDMKLKKAADHYKGDDDNNRKDKDDDDHKIIVNKYYSGKEDNSQKYLQAYKWGYEDGKWMRKHHQTYNDGSYLEDKDLATWYTLGYKAGWNYWDTVKLKTTK